MSRFEHREPDIAAEIGQAFYWSFYASQGDQNLQRHIFHLLGMLHPEAKAHMDRNLRAHIVDKTDRGAAGLILGKHRRRHTQTTDKGDPLDRIGIRRQAIDRGTELDYALYYPEETEGMPYEISQATQGLISRDILYLKVRRGRPRDPDAKPAPGSPQDPHLSHVVEHALLGGPVPSAWINEIYLRIGHYLYAQYFRTPTQDELGPVLRGNIKWLCDKHMARYGVGKPALTDQIHASLTERLAALNR